ncbi:hypothetical protein EIC84_14380 [Comamonas sp. A23]|nr:hypothetical protein EIC84_14380 [Comamonas sp. A23]
MHLTRAALICRATMRSSSCPSLAVCALGFACRAGLGWAGLGWAGLGWAGLGWAGLVYDSVTACDTPTQSRGASRGCQSLATPLLSWRASRDEASRPMAI